MIDSRVLIAVQNHPYGGSAVASADRPSHLHPQPTRLLGRERECAAVQQLLLSDDIRLVNLIGPAGVGKTRLAIEVGSAIGGRFAEGVCFIDMTPVRDPALVSSSLAHGVGLQDTESGSLRERLERYLQDRHTLLILDNFEQVIAGAQQLADFLGCCPRIKLLVTSREPLHLLWEHAIPVEPLPLPNLQPLPALDVLSQVASVALFLDRAGAINPSFVLREDNAQTVAELCVHLDGLPLALELAAARAKLLSPQMMLDRLKDRFSLLRWQAQDLPERQHTLQSAIAWSYNLLDEEERRLFRHVGVFEGGFTLEAAEALEARMLTDTGPGRAKPTRGESMTVAGVLDGMTSLVDKSLVLAGPVTEDGVRYRMLDGIREYALAQLGAQGEDEAAQRAHAASFLTLAETAEPELRTKEQRAWFVRLEQDHENVRAALRWLLDHDEGDVALRMATTLGYFWLVRGYIGEGRRWLEEALAKAPDADPQLRAQALSRLGDLLVWLADEEQYPREVLEEALGLATAAQDTVTRAWSLTSLGVLGLNTREWDRSRRHLKEALTYWKDAGIEWGTAITLVYLGAAELGQGHYREAASLLEDSLARFREVGDAAASGLALIYLVFATGQQGDVPRAKRYLQHLFELSNRAQNRRLLCACNVGVAWLLRDRGNAQQLTCLLGVIQRLHQMMGVGFGQISYTNVVISGTAATLRARLGQETFEGALAEGRSLTLHQSIGLIRELLGDAEQGNAPAEPTREPGGTLILSPREQEVLRLVARGLSNKTIANQLIIAPTTVSYHITSAFNKLGVNTRAQAIAEATRRDLI